MSLITQMLVFEKYGLRLGMEQLAEALGMAKASLYNQVSARSMPVPTYLDGGKRYADFRDVAKHFDDCRAQAHVDAGLAEQLLPSSSVRSRSTRIRY